jgi:Arc/MetJ-type ribon-helix-helix transcriptional regulator
MSAVQARTTKDEIQWLVERGDCPDSETVISKSVLMLYEYISKMTTLRTELEAAIAQPDRGETTRWTREAFEAWGREVDEAYLRGEEELDVSEWETYAMSAVATNVTQEQIQWLVDTGLYPDAASVVAEAVRVLYEYTWKSDELDKKLDRAFDQLDRGEGIPWTSELRAELRRQAEEMDLRGEPLDSDG